MFIGVLTQMAQGTAAQLANNFNMTDSPDLSLLFGLMEQVDLYNQLSNSLIKSAQVRWLRSLYQTVRLFLRTPYNVTSR